MNILFQRCNEKLTKFVNKIEGAQNAHSDFMRLGVKNFKTLSIDARILLHNLQNILCSTLDLWGLNLYESAKNGKHILQACFECLIIATIFLKKGKIRKFQKFLPTMFERLG